jgi:hypothetical protein
MEIDDNVFLASSRLKEIESLRLEKHALLNKIDHYKTTVSISLF